MCFCHALMIMCASVYVLWGIVNSWTSNRYNWKGRYASTNQICNLKQTPPQLMAVKRTIFQRAGWENEHHRNTTGQILIGLWVVLQQWHWHDSVCGVLDCSELCRLAVYYFSHTFTIHFVSYSCGSSTMHKSCRYRLRASCKVHINIRMRNKWHDC